MQIERKTHQFTHKHYSQSKTENFTVWWVATILNSEPGSPELLPLSDWEFPFDPFYTGGLVPYDFGIDFLHGLLHIRLMEWNFKCSLFLS